jgi:hypothetical protein
MLIRGRDLLLGAAFSVLGTLAACNLGPSEQRLGCLNGCAREKDQCVLNAMTSQGIEACDVQGRTCTEPCPQ